MIDTEYRLSHITRSVVLLLLLPVALWSVVMVTIPMEGNSALLALAIMVVPLGIVVLGSSESRARQWAEQRGALFDEPGVEQVRRHLVRTRLARTVGVTAGLAVPLMLMSHNNANPGAFPWFIDTWNKQAVGLSLPGLGYVMGSWWSEATKPRDRLGHDAGTAVLTPRRLRDYLDTGVQRVLVAFLAIALAAIGVWRFAPFRQTVPFREFPWLGVLLPLVVAAFGMLLAMWTCRRRELAPDEAALAYEELTRTATANALTGCAVAMLGDFAAGLVYAPYNATMAPWWLTLPFSAAGLLSLGFWASSGTKLVFRSRRIDTLRAHA